MKKGVRKRRPARRESRGFVESVQEMLKGEKERDSRRELPAIVPLGKQPSVVVFHTEVTAAARQDCNLATQIERYRVRMEINALRIGANLLVLFFVCVIMLMAAACVLVRYRHQRLDMHMIVGLRPMHMPRDLIRPMRMMPAAAEQDMQAESGGRDKGDNGTHGICPFSSVLRGEG
jgi:hypothetical protein